MLLKCIHQKICCLWWWGGGIVREFRIDMYTLLYFKMDNQGLPGDAVVKNLPASAEDTGLIPGPG